MAQPHGALVDHTLPSNHIPVQALVATAVNGAALDMSGWDGVCFVINAGVFGTNGTLSGLVQRDDNSGFNSPTNITNAVLASIPAANANAVAVVDVFRPAERYVRMQLTGQTNGVTAGCVAIRYRRNAGVLPATQSAQQVVKIVES